MSAEHVASALASRYRIERELGAGGMATVYLAADLKHDRKVAIKVLKPELAAVLGAERFVVEIKTTAALSHPHILPLFDSGEAGGYLYYVMPYIQGDTVREKLNRETQFGVDDAVRIAREVADALDYAHRNGVIHRDIKPENILLHDGRAMVMDFGIALAVSAAAGGRMTETGLSLGTPHYMSPEQATADKEISARSDVYSLASVLYEMLTGNPPHTGSSAQQIIMKIITEQPQPVTVLRKSVHPNVAAALSKALEKLPADRFASAREFADALHNPSFTTGLTRSTASGMDSVRMAGRVVSWRATALAFGTAFVALATWAILGDRGSPPSAAVVRAELNILTRSDSGVSVNGIDISRDGSMIVYSALPPRQRDYQLYLRRLDDRTAHAIPGSEGGTSPVFSPDGASIAFVHRRAAIRRIRIGEQAVTNVAQERDASFVQLRWADDGFLYYRQAARSAGQRLSRVRADGGTPAKILDTGDPENPEPLPDGKHVLYTECCDDEPEVRAVNVETGETQSIGVTARQVRYLPSGHLLLLSGDAARAVPFDARRLAVRGEPRIVLDTAATNGTIVDLAISANGTVSYFATPLRSERPLPPALVDLAGNEQRISLPDATYREFRFSPDGRRVAYVSNAVGDRDARTVFVHDLVVGTTVRVTSTPVRFVGFLQWMTGGARLLFAADNVADSITYIGSAHVDGSRVVDTLWRGTLRPGATEYLSPLAVTPDGKGVFLQRERLNGEFDLVVATLDSVLGPIADYLIADWREAQGDLSPDGRWAAYESNEEMPRSRPGQARIYVRAFPNPGERFAVSDGMGRNPLWAPDGKTIYYRRGPTLIAASVETTPTFRVTARRELFTNMRSDGYDITPDGTRFVMTSMRDSVSSAATPAPVPRLVIVANWITELRRKLGEQR